MNFLEEVTIEVHTKCAQNPIQQLDTLSVGNTAEENHSVRRCQGTDCFTKRRYVLGARRAVGANHHINFAIEVSTEMMN